MKNKYPDKINILGIPFVIEYHNNPLDVDSIKRESCWGQIDYWEKKIRIYDNNRPIEDIYHTLLHEILHGIEELLKIKSFSSDKGHEELDLIALALTDILFRNKMLKESEE